MIMADTISTTASTYTSNFQTTIESVPQPVSELLESYSGIPREAQAEHIISLRDEAYKLCPYPCIGNLRFLDFDLAAYPAYQEQVLAPLKRPAVDGEVEPLFLDLGTCFGQDVRRLAYDGAVVDRLWASDIEQHLIDLGFRLFNDGDKLPRSHFLCPGDLLTSSPGDRLRVLDGRVTILHLTAVFHLFTLEDQKTVADRCLRLLRKDAGAPVLILGAQAGSEVAGPFLRQNVSEEFSHKYRHNVQSWAALWESVRASDEWKGKIKKLEVSSEFRAKVRHPDQGPKNPAGQRGDGFSGMKWHVFEVKVTF
jgi:hypothetical protein